VKDRIPVIGDRVRPEAALSLDVRRRRRRVESFLLQDLSFYRRKFRRPAIADVLRRLVADCRLRQAVVTSPVRRRRVRNCFASISRRVSVLVRRRRFRGRARGKMKLNWRATIVELDLTITRRLRAVSAVCRRRAVPPLERRPAQQKRPPRRHLGGCRIATIVRRRATIASTRVTTTKSSPNTIITIIAAGFAVWRFPAEKLLDRQHFMLSAAASAGRFSVQIFRPRLTNASSWKVELDYFILMRKTSMLYYDAVLRTGYWTRRQRDS